MHQGAAARPTKGAKAPMTIDGPMTMTMTMTMT